MGAPNHSWGSSAAASAGKNPPLSPQTEFPSVPANDPKLRASARVRAAQGELRPLPRPPPPTLSSTPAPANPCSTRRSGHGQRHQPVVNPVKAMGGVVYVPKIPGVEAVNMIEVLDVAVERQGMVPHGPGPRRSLWRRSIGRLSRQQQRRRRWCKISTLRTSYHQLSSPNQKIGFVGFFKYPI